MPFGFYFKYILVKKNKLFTFRFFFGKNCMLMDFFSYFCKDLQNTLFIL